MLTKRIITCLDIKDGRTVKGINFIDLRDAGDPVEIARRCAFMVNKRDPIMPRFPIAEGRTEDEELASQAREGLRARLAVHPLAVPLEAYEARLEQEIAVIQNMGFSGYFESVETILTPPTCESVGWMLASCCWDSCCSLRL